MNLQGMALAKVCAGGTVERHSFYPYFEGESEKSFTHYDESKNNRIYALQQKAKTLKNKVKHLTKKVKVLEAGGVDAGKDIRKLQKVKSDLKTVNNELIFEIKYKNITDVTMSYKNNAIPNIGIITSEDTANLRDRQPDLDTAKWLIQLFGGDIKMLAENSVDLVPDVLWRDVRWEFKKASSKSTVESRIRKGLKQLSYQGGIVLDVSTYKSPVDFGEIFSAIDARLACIEATIDIIVKKDESLIRAIRKIKR